MTDETPILQIRSHSKGDLIEGPKPALLLLRGMLDKALAGEPQEHGTDGMRLTVRLSETRGTPSAEALAGMGGCPGPRPPGAWAGVSQEVYESDMGEVAREAWEARALYGATDTFDEWWAARCAEREAESRA